MQTCKQKGKGTTYLRSAQDNAWDAVIIHKVYGKSTLASAVDSLCSFRVVPCCHGDVRSSRNQCFAQCQTNAAIGASDDDVFTLHVIGAAVYNVSLAEAGTRHVVKLTASPSARHTGHIRSQSKFLRANHDHLHKIREQKSASVAGFAAPRSTHCTESENVVTLTTSFDLQAARRAAVF